MNLPYKVLGVYKPKIWNARKIGNDLTKITKDFGLVPLRDKDSRYEKASWHDSKLHAHLRRRTLIKPEGAQWHQDGDFGHVTMRHFLVLWSTNTPTELKANGVIYQPKPFEIILVDNLACFHRRPPDAPRKRWFFRQRVHII